MIVKEIMTTELITVAPDDTLSHAANLLRQYQFHHLPVVRGGSGSATWHWPAAKQTPLVFEGLLTSQDIDMAVALERESNSARELWQNRRVVEIMHRALIRVTPTTTLAAAALLLVERNLNCLPVIRYEEKVAASSDDGAVTPTSETTQNRTNSVPDVGTGSKPQTNQATGVAPGIAAVGDAEDWQEGRPLLVGLLTRSDLLTAFARSLGVFEPGMQ